MPNFDSPLGSKKVPGQPLREFEVPDETEENVVMRRRGPSMHGPQSPVDLNAAMEFQSRLQAEAMPQVIQGEEDAELERQIRAAKEARRTGKERLNDGAKRRIEMLVGMTRSTREVEIEGYKYIFQTLRSKEMREAIMAASEFDNTVQSPFEIRRQFLARSIIQLAGVDTSQFAGSNSLDAKLDLIDQLDEPLLNRLYEEYLALVKESRERYAVKNVQEMKEVVEDLKK